MPKYPSFPTFRITRSHPARTVMFRLAALGLLAVLLASQLPAPAQAQSSAWSEPVNLGPGWFPDITADLAGNVHLAWSTSQQRPNPEDPTGRLFSGYDQVMYTVLSGGKWSKPGDVVALKMNGGSEVTRPVLLVDPQGILHMTYRGVFVHYSNVPVSQAAVAQNWRYPYRFSDDQVSYFSRLAVDSKGTLHLVYTENVMTAACLLCYHIYYRQSADNGVTWSLRQDISVLPTGAAKPQLLIDRDDNLHVVWEAGQGGAYGQLSDPTTAFYTVSRDNGSTWAQPVEFMIPDGQAKNITIGEDGLGNLVFVWQALPGDIIYSQVSSNQGATWQPAEPIPGILGGWTVYPARLDDYTMAVDGRGDLHLVLVGRQSSEQTSLDLLHLTWNGRTWESPEVITTLQGDVPEWPRLAINRGNELHVTWFTRAEATIWNSDRGIFNIWYSKSVLKAPSQEVVVWPTPTLALTPEPTPIPPTSTPTPVDPNLGSTPVSPKLAEHLYQEADELNLIAVSLVPAAAIVLVAIAIVQLKRRL